MQAWLTRRSWQAAKTLSVLVNISAALIAKVLSETVDKRCPLSLTKPGGGTIPVSVRESTPDLLHLGSIDARSARRLIRALQF
ncbi:hypothetical protein [Streptomyces sp. NPDC006863]|uniref:hypothetical protein n=1 Tax=unclassified Streptomyces TaxID=2593676 RepID=UPI0033D1ACB4